MGVNSRWKIKVGPPFGKRSAAKDAQSADAFENDHC